jgi:4-coumarate--CoA ligase
MEPWLACISKYKITEVNIVPMMVITLLASGLLDSPKYSLRSICNAWAGSAPLDRTIQARMKTYLRHDVPFNQAWGMSETTCIATMFYCPEQDFTGSVGRFLPNCDAKIVDDDGKDISGTKMSDGTYMQGELCVRGPIIIKGYYKNDEANKRDWDEDGYFHTGDIAYCDAATRKVYIVDRKKVCGCKVIWESRCGMLTGSPPGIDQGAWVPSGAR